MAGLSQQAVVSQIDTILRKYSGVVSAVSSSFQHNVENQSLAEATSAMHAMIARFSYEGSKHLSNADDAVKQYGQSNSFCVEILYGILKALKADYEQISYFNLTL